MKKILIVEDSRIAQERMKGILSELFEMTTAKSGSEAIQKLEKESFHLVLLDLNMPTMNGWEFLSFLKEKALEIPVLVVTAERNSDKLKEVKENEQVKDVVHKPINDDLITFVEKYVSEHSYSLLIEEVEIVEEVEEVEEILEAEAEEVEDKSEVEVEEAIVEVEEAIVEVEQTIEAEVDEEPLDLDSVVELTGIVVTEQNTYEPNRKDEKNEEKIRQLIEGDDESKEAEELKKKNASLVDENKSLLSAISTLTTELSNTKASLDETKGSFRKLLDEREELIDLIKEFEKEKRAVEAVFREKEEQYLENNKKKDYILNDLESELTKLIQNEEVLQDEIFHLKKKLSDSSNIPLRTEKEEAVVPIQEKTDKQKIGVLGKLPDETIVKDIAPDVYEGYSASEDDYSLQTPNNEDVELLVEKSMNESNIELEVESESAACSTNDEDVEIVVGSEKEDSIEIELNNHFFDDDSQTERDLNQLIESNSNQMDSEISTLLKEKENEEDSDLDDYENYSINPPMELELLSQRREEIRGNSAKYRFSGDNDDIVLFDNDEDNKESKPGFFSAIKEVFTKK